MYIQVKVVGILFIMNVLTKILNSILLKKLTARDPDQTSKIFWASYILRFCGILSINDSAFIFSSCTTIVYLKPYLKMIVKMYYQYIINQKVLFFTITKMMKYSMYIGYDWPQTVA